MFKKMILKITLFTVIAGLVCHPAFSMEKRRGGHSFVAKAAASALQKKGKVYRHTGDVNELSYKLDDGILVLEDLSAWLIFRDDDTWEEDIFGMVFGYETHPKIKNWKVGSSIEVLNNCKTHGIFSFTELLNKRSLQSAYGYQLPTAEYLTGVCLGVVADSVLLYTKEHNPIEVLNIREIFDFYWEMLDMEHDPDVGPYAEEYFIFKEEIRAYVEDEYAITLGDQILYSTFSLDYYDSYWNADATATYSLFANLTKEMLIGAVYEAKIR